MCSLMCSFLNHFQSKNFNNQNFPNNFFSSIKVKTLFVQRVQYVFNAIHTDSLNFDFPNGEKVLAPNIVKNTVGHC